MGGMFTLVKMRKDWDGKNDPCWYPHPPETRARVASAAELRRDGIEVPAAPATKAGHGGHGH
jgi:hypothetical protein